MSDTHVPGGVPSVALFVCNRYSLLYAIRPPQGHGCESERASYLVTTSVPRCRPSTPPVFASMLAAAFCLRRNAWTTKYNPSRCVRMTSPQGTDLRRQVSLLWLGFGSCKTSEISSLTKSYTNELYLFCQRFIHGHPRQRIIVRRRMGRQSTWRQLRLSSDAVE